MNDDAVHRHILHSYRLNADARDTLAKTQMAIRRSRDTVNKTDMLIACLSESLVGYARNWALDSVLESIGSS